MALNVGQVLRDRFVIEELLSSGGFGAVYRAEDRNLQQTVAVKEMLTTSRDIEDSLERFKREGRYLLDLHHPHIPGVFDFWIQDNRAYIVMQFIEGMNLEDLLKHSGGRLDPLVAVAYAMQVCDVLNYLHTLSPPILHRDVKPANLILRPESHDIVLVDFGLARPVDPKTRTAVGTLGYVSLEQVQGKPEVRSDIYSLGVTLHEMLSGVEPVPFDMPRLESVAPWVPADLCALVNRATAREVSHRPPDARSMLRELTSIHNRLRSPVANQTRQFEVQSEPTVSSLPAPSPPRSPLLVGAIIGAVSATLVAALLNIPRQSTPAAPPPQPSMTTVVVMQPPPSPAALPTSRVRPTPKVSETVVVDVPQSVASPVVSTPVVSTPVVSTPVVSTPVVSTPVSDPPIALPDLPPRLKEAVRGTATLTDVVQTQHAFYVKFNEHCNSRPGGGASINGKGRYVIYPRVPTQPAPAALHMEWTTHERPDLLIVFAGNGGFCIKGRQMGFAELTFHPKGNVQVHFESPKDISELGNPTGQVWTADVGYKLDRVVWDVRVNGRHYHWEPRAAPASAFGIFVLNGHIDIANWQAD